MPSLRMFGRRSLDTMNAVLWIVQIALALLHLSGGAYKTFMFGELAAAMPVLSRTGWAALGVFEMACAVLLVAPAAGRWMPVLTPLAAAALVLEAIVLSALYARYSLAVTVTNPLMWAMVLGVMAALVAYGRGVARPIV